MKRNILLLLAFNALALTIVYYVLIHKKGRIEYEFSVIVPTSATNFEITSKWWIPRSVNLGQTSIGSFIMDSTDMSGFISQFQNIHLEGESTRIRRYVLSQHIKNADLMIYLYPSGKDKMYVVLNADYN